MKRKTLLAAVSVFLVVCLICMFGCKDKQPNITSISILKDGYAVNELNVLVGDKIALTAKANDDSAPNVSWTSSKIDVATISSSGELDVKGEGTTIITATETVTKNGISHQIFVTAKQKVEQTGVGTGTSSEDPIFLGNEGKDEPLEIYFIEMQHIYADSIFIKKGNVEVLIDAGWQYDGLYINTILKEKVADNRLDMSMMIDFGGVGSGNVKATRDKYIPKGMTYHSAYDCANQQNGAQNRYYLTNELYVDVLNTGNYILNTESTASNPHSLATIFNYKEFKFFTAGDLTIESEKALMNNENLPNVTLYKASHHGSHGSNSQELLNKLDPQAVAISAARANNYNDKPGEPQQDKTYNLNAASGHPAAAAIERIYKAPKISSNLNVYWNAVNGTMKFTTYGEDGFTFSGSATTKGYYDLTLTGGKPVWNETLKNFENKVTGEENLKLHETKAFVFRNYIQYLPAWAQQQYFPEFVG